MPKNTTSPSNKNTTKKKRPSTAAGRRGNKGANKAPARKGFGDYVRMLREAWRGEMLRFVIGLLVLVYGVIMLISFSSHFVTGIKEQTALESGKMDMVQNVCGSLGAHTADYFMDQCFGVFAYLIAIFALALGFKLLGAYRVRLWKWFINCAIIMVWGSTTLCLVEEQFLAENHLLFGDVTFHAGGLHGLDTCHLLINLVGVPGTYILLLTLAILYMCYLSSETIHLVRKALKPQDLIRDKVKSPSWWSRLWSRRNEEDEYDEEEYEDEEIGIDCKADNLPTDKEEDEQEFEDRSTYSIRMSTEVGDTESTTLTIATSPDTEEKKDDLELQIEEAAQEEEADGDSVAEALKDLEPYDPRKDLENYQFPGLDLLKRYTDNGPAIDMIEQHANKDRILSVLKSFGVEISDINATIGPTITLYEITPAQGVRISKIRNLEDDIALSLSALGIRIIAPIPGKGTIGIEVPNKNPRIVSMENILNTKKFQESTYELPIALGRTITNEVYMVDLAKMPHLLVAGATGQGKSVGLNAIITSLLYKKHPAELKFVMVDPKKVEFSVYSPLENHFLAKIPGEADPIITDVTKVVQTLKSLCQLMDHRYDLLKKARVRNIKEYNAKFKARQLNPENGHEFMPYIVVIIDEFGDLIMTAGKEVELPIARIAQLARAVGMHMVIATQRPTTNIITGTIKANFPARMAFKVMSQIDSRTILDRNGANQLVGRGDMLFMSGVDPVRVQCAFVDTPEVERINSFICTQQSYLSAYELPEPINDGDGEGGGSGQLDAGEIDPMFLEAARLIVVHQLGSTSLIQRKFSIGYNRAGRLMDQMERAGIVGPSRGAKPREVLVADETELEAKYQSLL